MHFNEEFKRSKREDSRFNAQREVLTHGYRGFEVFLALFTDQLSSEMRSSEGRQIQQPVRKLNHDQGSSLRIIKGMEILDG